jgi:hypothetical protein
MRRLIALCATACLLPVLTTSAPAAWQQKDGYTLRDTTSLPPPAAGMARLVVARDMRILDVADEEFVFLDRTPLGKLPQRTALATEVTPGWHRVWLGRGRSSQVWMEFAPGARYLLRLRERVTDNVWRGDLVRESGEGYAEFALGRGMKLAVLDKRGEQELLKDLGRRTPTAREDSTALAKARAGAALPIVIREAWYLPLPSDESSHLWMNSAGTLTLDATSLRYTRGDSLVLEIPRTSVTDVYFGAQKGNVENPWIKVGYRLGETPRSAGFADASLPTATENYNRLFAELARTLPR